MNNYYVPPPPNYRSFADPKLGNYDDHLIYILKYTNFYKGGWFDDK